MKSVMRTIVRVVRRNKRNWTDTLRPKGMEPDYNGCVNVLGNGQLVPGLKMASKVCTIICDMELGKPHMLPKLGRNFVRSDDGIGGRGYGRKQMSACNGLNRGSKFALTRKGADLPWVFHCMNGSKPMNVSYSTTPKSERLTDTQRSVNGLRAGITKAGRKLLPDTERVMRRLSGMKGNFHVPFLDEGRRVIASS